MFSKFDFSFLGVDSLFLFIFSGFGFQGWIPGFGVLGSDSWVWSPGLGFLDLESWVWIPGFGCLGFLDLDS